MTETTLRVSTTTRVKRHALVRLSVDAIGRGLNFGLVYTAQRVLGPAAYGEFTYALAIGFVISTLADLGLNLIAAREIAREPAQAEHLSSLVFTLKLGLAALAAVCLVPIGLARPIETRFAVFALGLAMIASIFIDFFGYVLRGLQRADLEAWLVLFMRVLTFISGLLALSAHGGLAALATAYLISVVVAVLLSVWWLRRRFVPLTLSHARAAQWRWLKEALPLGGAIVVSIVYTRLPIFLLDALRGPGEVGVYGVAQKLTEPLSFFPAAVLAAVFPALSAALAQHDIALTRSLRRRTVVVLSAAGGAVAVGGLAVGPWLIEVLYHAEYIAAASVLQILTLTTLLTFLNYALTHFIVALGQQRLNFIFNMIILLIYLALGAILIPRFGANGAALAVLVCESTLMLLCAWALRNLHARTN